MKMENAKYLVIGFLIGLAFVFLLAVNGNSPRYQFEVDGAKLYLFDTHTNTVKVRFFFEGLGLTKKVQSRSIDLRAEGLID